MNLPVELEPKNFPLLVVDDEPDNLDTFRFNYRKAFDVHTATSGARALEMARQTDFAVVVTDQRMPGMDGLELLKGLRAIRPDAVGIILTAYTDVEVLINAVNLGKIYGFMTKPWDSKELRGVMVQAIERFHLHRENARLQSQLAQYATVLSNEAHEAFNFGAIVGQARP